MCVFCGTASGTIKAIKARRIAWAKERVLEFVRGEASRRVRLNFSGAVMSRSHSSSAFDDLLGNLGRKETELKKESVKVDNDSSAFDDLLPGFGNSSSPNRLQVLY
ncbi:hypothetical protein HS088_TW04G01090 [Tripterygium wilfordii]|uniref:Uncharacterized protein n=1 Tax=Tripterygium wilfordii TaxID=458696 RepID=A0A7J7DS48_TRIWF|nr:hypothetical protein HS088_TW04G01090 [Tripterygium wilfordii]